MTGPAGTSSTHEHPPTRDQLALLRRLAERTAQTFAYPTTRAEAGEEIRRLCAVVLSRPSTPALDALEPASATAFRVWPSSAGLRF